MIMDKLLFKRTISIISVIMVIVLLFYLYLPPQPDPILTMRTTLRVDAPDVLCVGSSHMFCGINPIQLYEDRGIAAYNLACGSQSPWQSYYYIKEACKENKPELIIFDTYMVGCVQDVNHHYQDFQTVVNMLGFPFGINKALAVMESPASSKLSIIVEFPYSYDDLESYPGLTVHKHHGNVNYTLGYSYNTGIEEYPDVIDVSNITVSSDIHPKNEKYLRKIIEYCQENKIDILLTNTPWPCVTEQTQRYFNRIREIADEYDVQFINGCNYYSDMGIDYMTDSYGDGGHLNYSGVTKYTSWLESYLDVYELPDRRNDPEYDAWNKAVDYLDDKLSVEIDI